MCQQLRVTHAEGEGSLPSANGSAGSGENWAPAASRLTWLSPPERRPNELFLYFLLTRWVRRKVDPKWFSVPGLTPEPLTDV